ncbi:hypothetical protein RIF29_41776 [Crotalaria pallida]|uniref:Uncharacterized protein n=1 Tax=Crotalaria pallida TaxID=3830 RepID=A0AAN9E6A5_CROPI
MNRKNNNIIYIDNGLLGSSTSLRSVPVGHILLPDGKNPEDNSAHVSVFIALARMTMMFMLCISSLSLITLIDYSSMSTRTTLEGAIKVDMDLGIQRLIKESELKQSTNIDAIVGESDKDGHISGVILRILVVG